MRASVEPTATRLQNWCVFFSSEQGRLAAWRRAVSTVGVRGAYTMVRCPFVMLPRIPPSTHTHTHKNTCTDADGCMPRKSYKLCPGAPHTHTHTHTHTHVRAPGAYCLFLLLGLLCGRGEQAVAVGDLRFMNPTILSNRAWLSSATLPLFLSFCVSNDGLHAAWSPEWGRAQTHLATPRRQMDGCRASRGLGSAPARTSCSKHERSMQWRSCRKAANEWGRTSYRHNHVQSTCTLVSTRHRWSLQPVSVKP
jgi:hypothetical protein